MADNVTVDSNKQWGSADVQVKEHPRNYQSGKVMVETFSAKCPGTSSRKRLKKIHDSIYQMECLNGGVLEIDVVSGNFIDRTLFEVNVYTPKTATEITALEYENLRQKGVYGIGTLDFALPEIDIDNSLTWHIFFVDKGMTEAIASAFISGDFVYIAFTV